MEKEDKKKLLDDTISNKKSLKRLVSIAAFVVLVVGFFVDMFTSYTVNKEYADIFLWIVGVGLFGVVAERFMGKKNNGINSGIGKSKKKIDK